MLRDLEERMDRRPDQVAMDEILDARSSLLPLSEMVNDWLPVVQSLKDVGKPPFGDPEVRDYINCAVVNLNASAAQLDRMDGRIDALHAGFQMYAQEKTNHRLGVLTILSAVFMPITLLAGIWGMNFDQMPELHFAWSYPVALLTMGAIGATMYLFFRFKGWFK
jgi:magnesium transporter